ncbi:hydroxyethylthiazole kinase [Terrarubrum flagellatum]|uniref:hydroxyethylthiazole kinase n=1 Tax=Terrirubrum flagellatum TaxID=2895980 RepID=UPI00314514E9
MQDIASIISAVRAQRPLVHNITNYVVMNFSANALLAFGASPAMVHAPEEVEDFVAISSSLVVNIGTLDSRWVESMKLAAAKASALKKPWVLDPVGVGATRFRLATSQALLALKPAIVRGNAAEIITLAGASGGASKGVDSLAASSEAIGAARALARSSGAVVVATGENDIATDGERVFSIAGGSAQMTLVTGTGCCLSATVAATAAVASDPLSAAVAACAVYKVAAERAASEANAPGSLAVAFLDALHEFQPDDYARLARIETL